MHRLLAFLAFPSLLGAQTTWIVDAQGGANFTTIQAAVQAANVLAVAFPGAAQSMGIGTLWLDSASVAVLAIGTVPITGAVPVPASVPRGMAIAVQGVLLHQGVLRLSPPLLDAVR